MTFLQPLALLGLAAAAIPALLHLLERRVPPQAVFPPLRYLTEAERQSARRLKLRHLLLLALRMALIVAVVLAAARPVVRSAAGAASLHEPTALAVILDNSPSSGVIADGRPLLEQLKAAARESFERASSADRLWLMLADGVARRGTRETLLGTVERVTPSPYRLDLTIAVRAAARLVDAEPLTGREVHVVSDLQRTALGPGRSDGPRGVRILALAPPDRVPANRGIGTVRVADGTAAIGVVGTPGAGVGPVTVTVRGRDVSRTVAAPGSTVSVALPSLGVGWWQGEAVLDPDELRADDRRLMVWRVAAPARVAALPGAGPFVATALAVLEEGQRIQRGGDVAVSDRADAGRVASIVLPPADQALLGQANRALEARGVRWRFGTVGTPGPIAGAVLPGGAGLQVVRRYRLEAGGQDAGAGGPDSTVLATVNGEPWLVRDQNVLVLGSRLDTAWTTLPATPQFVPFVDALVNRLARGESPVAEAEGAAHIEFRTRGADTIGATVFGPDPRESDLTPAPAALVRATVGAQVLDPGAFAAARFAGIGRRDVSGALLALALVLALLELGVATLTR